MLWRKFGQMHVECGKAVLRVTGHNLAENYHDSHNRNRSGQFYAELGAFQIVMLDDLDKMALRRLSMDSVNRPMPTEMDACFVSCSTVFTRIRPWCL